MLQYLWQFFKTHVFIHTRAFTKGCLGGTIAGGAYFFGQPLLTVNIWFAYLIKLAGTGGIALVSGIGTALAADIYRHRIKQHIVKKKENVKKAKKTETDETNRKTG